MVVWRPGSLQEVDEKIVQSERVLPSVLTQPWRLPSLDAGHVILPQATPLKSLSPGLLASGQTTPKYALEQYVWAERSQLHRWVEHQ